MASSKLQLATAGYTIDGSNQSVLAAIMEDDISSRLQLATNSSLHNIWFQSISTNNGG